MVILISIAAILVSITSLVYLIKGFYYTLHKDKQSKLEREVEAIVDTLSTYINILQEPEKPGVLVNGCINSIIKHSTEIAEKYTDYKIRTYLTLISTNLFLIKHEYFKPNGPATRDTMNIEEFEKLWVLFEKTTRCRGIGILSREQYASYNTTINMNFIINGKTTSYSKILTKVRF